MEYRLRHASGEYRIILDLGTPNYNSKGDFSGYIGYCFDITERKRIEGALSEREDRLSKIFMAANDGMWDWNLSTNEVYFDPRYYNMSGYETDEFPHLLDEFVSRIHPRDTDYVMGEADRHLTGKTDCFNVKFRFRNKSGAWQWIEGKGQIVERDAEGTPLRFIGTHRDITELKQVEEKISKINEQLEQRVVERTAELEASNRDLEAFSYSVSHDLRAPLRHINGYVNLLNDRFRDDLPDLAKHYLSSITEASRQMGTLIDNLLDFSRSGRQEVIRVKLDMNILLKEAIEEVVPENEERTINWSLEELPQLFGDSIMLKQVWINLLDNAVKYTRNTNPTEISVGFKAENSSYVFYVRDNGVGFNMNYAQKLFGVFQRLHSQSEFEGTGIGLANVQRIIHKHNGQVWAEAESGKGAVFFFSLPKQNGELP
jgi:PAS domain S-box-containing protein